MLFIDVENDGDQDIVLVNSGGPVLYLNDGKGVFKYVPNTFGLRRPLQGVPISTVPARSWPARRRPTTTR